MQRVDVALGRHGLRRRRQGLPQHLPAEHGAPAEVLALAAEEIDLDALEGELLHQIVEDLAHDALPARARPSSTSATTIAVRRA